MIATGGASTVRLHRNPTTGKPIVVKSVPIANAKDGSVLREVEFLVRLNHPCVLRIVGWARPGRTAHSEIHTEFAENRSLKHFLSQNAMFPNPTQQGLIICDIVLGMRYVHAQRIIHGDLKPSNILITGDWRALIADFGTSRVENEAEPAQQGGTVCYAAPELFDESVNCTRKVDVFSFGFILYEMLVGKPVFRVSENPLAVLTALRNGQMPPIPVSCGPIMQGLIGRCWSRNPEDRPTFQEIFAEFQSVDFAILPDADGAMIDNVVAEVLTWESLSP
jgi:serine/threonine protein kinase